VLSNESPKLSRAVLQEAFLALSETDQRQLAAFAKNFIYKRDEELWAARQAESERIRAELAEKLAARASMREAAVATGTHIPVQLGSLRFAIPKSRTFGRILLAIFCGAVATAFVSWIAPTREEIEANSARWCELPFDDPMCR
jgi:hypothetical protein